MTATKLMHAYRYQGGEWEYIEPHNPSDYTFELWNGSHEDEVTLYGYEDGGNRRVALKVSGGYPGIDAPASERIKTHTRYSAAYKWGYAHAVLYGDPRTPQDPYVAVLEIAEDAFKHPDYERDYGPVSPHPYAVFVHLGFTTHTVFVDGFPDLTRLLGEVLPLVGSPKPKDVSLYDLHKWAAT
jgi:hypothetical protein